MQDGVEQSTGSMLRGHLTRVEGLTNQGAKVRQSLKLRISWIHSRHYHTGEIQMLKPKYLLAVTIAVVFAGCAARSFFPLFAEKDLVFNPSLVGTWAAEGTKDTYTFRRATHRSYEVIYYQDKHSTVRGKEVLGDTAVFTGQLGHLGDYWFLDLLPEWKSLESHLRNDTYNFHWIPIHTFSKVRLEGDTLQVTTLEGDWLKKIIESDSLKIPRLQIGDEILLSTPTEELQQLVLRFAEDTKAFASPGKLIRLK